MSSFFVLFNYNLTHNTFNYMTASLYPELWVISAVKILSAALERVLFIKRIPPFIFLWFCFGIFQNLLLFPTDSWLLSMWSLETKYLWNCLVSRVCINTYGEVFPRRIFFVTQNWESKEIMTSRKPSITLVMVFISGTTPRDRAGLCLTMFYTRHESPGTNIIF